MSIRPALSREAPASLATDNLIPRRVQASRLCASRRHAPRPYTARESLKLSESTRPRCLPTDPTNDPSQSNPVLAPYILTTTAPRQDFGAEQLGQVPWRPPQYMLYWTLSLQRASQAACLPQAYGRSSHCFQTIGAMFFTMAADRVNAILQTAECWQPGPACRRGDTTT